MSDRLLTSESVTEGHPDKLADRISDAVLDAVLAADPAGRVACETLVTGPGPSGGGGLGTPRLTAGSSEGHRGDRSRPSD